MTNNTPFSRNTAMIPKRLLTVFFLSSVLIDLVAEKFIHVLA